MLVSAVRALDNVIAVDGEIQFSNERLAALVTVDIRSLPPGLYVLWVGETLPFHGRND